jgi:hypothetical protein
VDEEIRSFLTKAGTGSVRPRMLRRMTWVICNAYSNAFLSVSVPVGYVEHGAEDPRPNAAKAAAATAAAAAGGIAGAAAAGKSDHYGVETSGDDVATAGGAAAPNVAVGNEETDAETADEASDVEVAGQQTNTCT